MSENKKNWLLNSIWLIAVVPLAIAWVMAWTGYGVTGMTKNKGELMPSGLVVPEQLIEAQQGHWGLIIVSDTCPSLCQQQLYRAQQLYLSMGKEAKRLQTIWVSNDRYIDPQQLEVQVEMKPEGQIKHDETLSDVQFQKMIQLNSPTTFSWFNNNEVNWQDQSIFFVDPLGNLVLRFHPELPGRDMISDIKWLLKASRLG